MPLSHQVDSNADQRFHVGEPNLSATHGYIDLPHLPPQEYYQRRTAMEGLKDPCGSGLG